MSRHDDAPEHELGRELSDEAFAEVRRDRQVAEEWHAKKRAELEAQIAELGVPQLLGLVQGRLKDFAGDQDFLFGVAVGCREKYYMRALGLSYPEASRKAIAMTHLLTGRGLVR